MRAESIRGTGVAYVSGIKRHLCDRNGPERSGAPGEIRTPDLLVRSQALYPTELRARTVKAHIYVGPRADGGELPSNQGVAFASPLDPLELSGRTNAGREPSRGAHPTTSTPESSRPRATFLPAAGSRMLSSQRHANRAAARSTSRSAASRGPRLPTAAASRSCLCRSSAAPR
jgi:hypothetical protein